MTIWSGTLTLEGMPAKWATALDIFGRMTRHIGLKASGHADVETAA